MRNISNMDPNFQIPILQFPEREGIVKILGVLRVNGKRQNLAKVLPFTNLVRVYTGIE